MKKHAWFYCGFAECKDCGWKSDSYKNLLGISAIHARRYKHKVAVDLGFAAEYDGSVD